MAAQKVRFGPRRLAHGNLFVSNLERSLRFYTRVCGLREVFREPPIKAGFLSNGSSHHDVALIEISDRTRRGGDGYVTIPASQGRSPGLNHFGWEMETEAQLVEAYRRARESGLEVRRTANHQVSHSVYVFDPEGNFNEFYSDAADDWREVWRPGNTDVLTIEWSPEEAEPSTKPLYVADPDLSPEPGSIIPSRQINHGVLVANDYEKLLAFYTDVAGLEIAYASTHDTFAVLSGSLSGRDLALLPAAEGRPPGMHHVGFRVFNEDELQEAETRLRAEGIEPEMTVDHPTKRSLFLKDPDGIRLEFYVKRPAPLSALADTGGYDPAYLL